jgi:hypothetical protein
MKKGKLKKILAVTGVTVLVTIVVLALLFSLYGDKVIRVGIEKGATAALKVDVRLEDITTRLLLGKVTLNNLEIDNPEGYDDPTFMKLGYAHMKLDTTSLLSDTIVMSKFQLDNVQVILEQKLKTNNLKDILKNLPKSDPEEPAPQPEPKEKKPSKNFRIDVLEINNVEVKANLLPGTGKATSVKLTLKPIRLENIGSKNKVDTKELTARIIKAIAKGIAEQGGDILPTDMVKDLGAQLGKLGEDTLKAGKDLGKKVTEDAKGIGEGFKGLFKKKEEE